MKLKSMLKIFSQEYRSSIYYKKVLYSYLLVSCVIFSIFSVIMSLFINKDYSNTLENIQDHTITQVHNFNQTTLKDIVAYCYTILDTPTMSNILYGDTYNSTLALSATELNDNLLKISSLINSVYFINFNTDTIIDHNGRTAISNHTDSGIFDILREMTPSIRPLFCYPRYIDNLVNNKAYTNVPVLTMIFYSSKLGALVLNLDYDTYCTMLSLESSSYIDIIMINSSGKVMSASNPDLFGVDYSENKLYQTVQASSKNHGSFLYRQEGQYDSVKYIKNKGLGITYICTLNKLYIYPENAFLVSLLQYTAIYLFIGIILSLLLSWLIYNPLRQLKSYIASHSVSAVLPTELSEESNDFHYLSQAYQTILEINTDLQHVNHAYLKEQNRKFFKALLTDASDISATYSSELEILNAALSEKNNLILLLGIDPESHRTELQAELSLLKYVIQNVMEELLSSAFTVRYIDMDMPYVIFLINYSDPALEKIIQLIKEAQDFILLHYQITFSAGIGEEVEDLTEISLSYSSAYEAFSQRFISGNGSIHTAGDLHLIPVLDQTYPFEISDALLSSMKALSAGDTSGYLHKFFSAIRPYHIDQILFFTLQLCSSLQRLEQANYIAAEGDWNYKVLEQSTLAEIEEKLLKRCLKDIEQMVKIKESSSGKKELIDEIIKLVENNIYNPNLSVMFLADSVHLSVNYLRNIFKENTGESLSVYITRQKLDLIRDLLLHSDMSLNDISEKLGFSTKNYFFTFFKKHTGMTPSDYRKKQRTPRSASHPSVKAKEQGN